MDNLDAATLMLPSGGSPPDSLHGRRIATLDVEVIQSKHRPLVGERTPVSALAEVEWILNPQGCGYRAALQRAIEGAGRQIRMGVDTHGTDMQLRLVAAGLGLGSSGWRRVACCGTADTSHNCPSSKFLIFRSVSTSGLYTPRSLAT